MDLSLNLKAVISQRLVKSKDGKRVPAVEIMLLTTFVAELIQKGDIHAVKEAMEQGNERGMQTFDQALYKLYKDGLITLEEALANADSRNNLSLKIRLSESGSVGGGSGAMSISDEEFF
jgi:twitching motility protein PilU